MKETSRTIAICGGSGLIGRHLVCAYARDPQTQLRLLMHRHRLNEVDGVSPVVHVTGDMQQPESLSSLLTRDCTVINLVFMPTQSHDSNLEAVSNLAGACRIAGVKRLVHVSTATVVGATHERQITEAVQTQPSTAYERTKLAVEELLIKEARNAFELVILRPTAVFGPDSKNLAKLAAGLLGGNTLANYARSCFHGHRRMNLVCVDNVVAAIQFAAGMRVETPQIFIVSDDDDELNNYRDVELMLMNRFGCSDYIVPPLGIPRVFYRMVLRLLGRSNVNPDRVYSARKLTDAGFKKAISFISGLDLFSGWYRHHHVRSVIAVK